MRLRVKPWQAYVAIIGVISGFLLVSQIQAQLAQRASTQENRNMALVRAIENSKKQIDQLGKEMEALRKQIKDMQDSQLSGENEVSGLQDKLTQLQGLAGLTPVQGPGIVIVLDDNTAGAEAAKTDPSTYQPEDWIIHDKNILYIVNELREAGAEAIAVNDQRVVGTTEIRCQGNVINVNQVPLAPPYEIKAIGDPARLEQAIASGEEFPYLKLRQFPVKLSQSQHLELPAYRSNLKVDALKPLGEKENS